MKIVRYTLVLLFVVTCAHGMEKRIVVKSEDRVDLGIFSQRKKDRITLRLRDCVPSMVILAFYVGILMYKYSQGLPIDVVINPCTGRYTMPNSLEWQICCRQY